MATGWLAPDEVLDDTAPYWPMCDVEDPDALAKLLEAARIQCEAFAPALADTDVAPENYRLAQGFQARALYRSAIAGSGDRIGGDGLAVTVFPMDWTVKNLLRPKRIGRVL